MDTLFYSLVLFCFLCCLLGGPRPAPVAVPVRVAAIAPLVPVPTVSKRPRRAVASQKGGASLVIREVVEETVASVTKAEPVGSKELEAEVKRLQAMGSRELRAYCTERPGLVKGFMKLKRDALRAAIIQALRAAAKS